MCASKSLYKQNVFNERYRKKSRIKACSQWNMTILFTNHILPETHEPVISNTGHDRSTLMNRWKPSYPTLGKNGGKKFKSSFSSCLFSSMTYSAAGTNTTSLLGTWWLKPSLTNSIEWQLWQSPSCSLGLLSEQCHFTWNIYGRQSLRETKELLQLSTYSQRVIGQMAGL